MSIRGAVGGIATNEGAGLATKADVTNATVTSSNFSGILAADKGGKDTRPLVNYGGMNFNGTTTYLDGNALTGSADSKLLTLLWDLRFANASSATEVIFSQASNTFRFDRTTAGNIIISAKDGAGSTNLSVTTSGGPCSAAGRYVFEFVCDLDSQANTLLFINGVQRTLTYTTFVASAIDFTGTDYAVGASNSGSAFFAGDIYRLYFNPGFRLDLSQASNLLRWKDVSLVPAFGGDRGELISGTGAIPLVYLAYSPSDVWSVNKGSSTGVYTQNGTIADAVVPLYGQYGGWQDKLDTATGTTGNRTINKPTGSVNMAAAASTLTVTNSLVTARHNVRVWPVTNDTTLKYAVAVSSAGSFTITGNANATAETRIAFDIGNL